VVSLGTFGTVLSAIDLLREVLEKSGVDGAKAAQIAGDFMSKLRSKGGSGGTARRRAGEADVSAAFTEESWEYGALTLVCVKPRRATKRLVPALWNGAELPPGGPSELAAYLNEMANDGWEVAGKLGGAEAPTLLLRREKR
jgi:hypothetical protein